MKFNIFLMVIDSLQARKFYGKKTSLTPNIDSLIKNNSIIINATSIGMNSNDTPINNKLTNERKFTSKLGKTI